MREDVAGDVGDLEDEGEVEDEGDVEEAEVGEAEPEEGVKVMVTFVPPLSKLKTPCGTGALSP